MSLQTRITALAQAVATDVKAIFTALSGKVDSTDTRLSNARTPTAHTHPIADIVTTVSEGIYLKNTPGGAVDLNTLTVPGNYSFGSAATNKPVAGGGTLLVGDIAGNVAQILVRLQNTSTPEVWYRTYGITSGWGSWLRITDSLVLASPPAIGSTTPASGKFTTLETTSGQIKFPAAQNPSADANTLDDYEEGTWAPGYAPTTGAFDSITYDALRWGRYTKVGRLVTVEFLLRTTDFAPGTASGNIRLTGLPFASTTGHTGSGIAYSGNFGVNAPNSVFLSGIVTYANLYYKTSMNAPSSPLQVGDMYVGPLASGNYIAGSFSYFAS